MFFTRWLRSMSRRSTRQNRSLGRAGRARSKSCRRPLLDWLEDRCLLNSGYGELPLAFEANLGQTDAQVDFLARGPDYSVFLAGGEAVLSILGPTDSDAPTIPGAAIRMGLVGANQREGIGMVTLSGVSNYLVGSDPRAWHTDIPNYSQVFYDDVFAGIDLSYYGTGQRRLEYDFVVSPGADPGEIGLSFTGIDGMRIDAQGDLVLDTAVGPIRQPRPLIYQEVAGARQEIAGGYLLGGNNQIRFALANYDTSRPLIIDPVITYSTYLGGSATDIGRDVAADAEGNAYVTGETQSANFPTTLGAFDTDHTGNFFDAFVTKFDPTGSTAVYSTYLGGSANDLGRGIAVDAAGNAYITGEATSTDFPTTPGAFDPDKTSPVVVFISKLNPAGNALVYSTYLGGIQGDQGRAIAVDANGSVYVTGSVTSASSFPTTPGAFRSTNAGGGDVFVSKLSPAGNGANDLVYSTYYGGNLNESGESIAVDADGKIYVTGVTQSAGLPTTPNAFQPALGGGFDAFVLGIDPSQAGAASLAYATYLGGSSPDNGTAFDGGIAVDVAGRVYVTGTTQSNNFPTTAEAFKTTLQSEDVFVAKLDPSQSGSAQLVYSTFLGGTSLDQGKDISVDAAGNAYVTGYTASSNFPTTPAVFQPNYGGGSDAFVAKLSADGSQLLYATYLGGTSGETSFGVTLDPMGNAYVTGQTGPSFPTTADAFQQVHAGGADAFVAQIPRSAMSTPPTAQDDAAETDEDTPVVIDVLANDSDPDGDELMPILVTGPAHGAVTLNNDLTFTYTPVTDYHGPDSFEYLARPEGEESNPATVTLTVRAVNDLPIANPDHYTVVQGLTLTVATPGVIGNDFDADGDTLSVSVYYPPNYNNATFNAGDDGSFTYAPAPGFVGTDNFSYAVTDGHGDSNVVDVTLEVIPPPQTDYGDAPDDPGQPNDYPTLHASGMPFHYFTGSVVLGALIDHEPDGQPTIAADGDDSSSPDDEDGVNFFLSPLVPGLSSTVEVTVQGQGYLNAWIDWNADRDWADPGEQVFTDLFLTTGTHPLTVTAPGTAVVGPTYARFRLDSKPGLSFSGVGQNGEMEDHQVDIKASGLIISEDPENAAVSVQARGVERVSITDFGNGAVTISVPSESFEQTFDGMETLILDIGSEDQVDYQYRGSESATPVSLQAVGFSPNDYGDAPATYGDAAHPLGFGAPFIGTAWDSEAGSQASANALGDDSDGIDDEDGVTFIAPLFASSAFDIVPDFNLQPHIRVPVLNFGADAYLDAWIDFDRSGTFDDFEHLSGGSFLIPAGAIAIDPFVTVPAGAVVGETYARFRVSRSGGLGPNGPAADGEVEDYKVTIHAFDDFGDAPASYGTLLADDGARHVGRGPLLGRSEFEPSPYVDYETNALPTPHADGDDALGVDDETGVAFPLPLVTWPGADLSNHVNVYAVLATTSDGWEEANLDAWIDFDHSGTFDAVEHFDMHITHPGPTEVPFTVPAGATVGDTYARFRISRRVGLGPTGPAPDGEVEDYRVSIVPLFFAPDPPPGTLVIQARGRERLSITDLGGGTISVSLPDVPLEQRFVGIERVQFDVGPTDQFSYEYAGATDSTRLEIDPLGDEKFDFGDAPQSYGDALHQLPRPTLGLNWDSEAGTQAHPSAEGDDFDFLDDEDGLVSYQLAASPVSAMDGYLLMHIPTSGTVYLDGWIDFNHSGAFESDEHINQGNSLRFDAAFVELNRRIPVTVPAGAVVGPTFARFRISNDGGLGPIGIAPDGEVEDHVVTITPPVTVGPANTLTVHGEGLERVSLVDIGNGSVNISLPLISFEQRYVGIDQVYVEVGSDDRFQYEFVGPADTTPVKWTPTVFRPLDFGDAPASYGDAAHLGSSLIMGSSWDSESVSQSFVGGEGDDLIGIDDEEGFGYDIVLVGSPDEPVMNQFYLSFPLVGDGAMLDAWLDVDHSGTFDASEKLFFGNSKTVSASDLTKYFTPVPTGAVMGETYARFRLSSAGGLGPTGMAADGEVEDHRVIITPFEVTQNLVQRTLTVQARAVGRVSITDLGDGTISVALPHESFEQTYDGIEWLFLDVGRDDQVDYEFLGGPNTTPVRWEPTDFGFLDFGDAPTTFPNTQDPTAYGDAVHLLSGPYLGVSWDTESATPANADALGDDANGIDDEDGVPFSYMYTTPDSPQWNHVAIYAYAANGAYLDAWIDADHDGAFQADEHLHGGVSQPLYGYVDSTYFAVPAGSKLGYTVARFRISTAGGLGPTGLASDGEVEDHLVQLYGVSVAHNLEHRTLTVEALEVERVSITDLGDGVVKVSVPTAEFEQTYTDVDRLLMDVGANDRVDYRFVGGPQARAVERLWIGSVITFNDHGDAPDTYGDASHVGSGPLFGAAWDSEGSGQFDAAAAGDDMDGFDDEDGVTLPPLRTSSASDLWNIIDVQLQTLRTPDAMLDAWIDYDQSGTFDRGEQLGGASITVNGPHTALHFKVPAGAKVGNTFARFRISTDGGLGPTGPALDGEVEDYPIVIFRSEDFGDAPDTYGTLLASNGARHAVDPYIGALRLGNQRDIEPDGQPTPGADGDDADTVDEDGVIFVQDLISAVSHGTLSELSVNVHSPAFGTALLDAWIDYDHSGTFDASEHLGNGASIPVHFGSNQIFIVVPAGATAGDTYARFRLSSSGGLGSTGPATDGEIEDYRVTITSGEDFGDAPASYGTLFGDDGARHTIGAGILRLGGVVDGESNGQPTLNADGDDGHGHDDEDGVTFNTLYAASTNHVGVTVFDALSWGAMLDAWIDFDHNGLFDADEHLGGGTSIPVSHGLNQVFFAVPADARLGETYARFRISLPGGLGPTGRITGGEVEDYRVTISTLAYALFDPGLGLVNIVGTAAADHLELSATQSGRLQIFATDGNRVQLPIFDATTRQPLDPNGNTWPTIFNTREIQARLGAGDDVFSAEGIFARRLNVDGEAGSDKVILRATDAADVIDVFDGPARGFEDAEIRIANRTNGAVIHQAFITGTEAIAIHAGAGNDEVGVAPVPIHVFLYCEDGDDNAKLPYTFPLVGGEGPIPTFDGWFHWDLGQGQDRLELATEAAPEFVEIIGEPAGDVPDPRLRVTDLASGRVVVDLSVVNTEIIDVRTAGGGDRVSVLDEHGLLSGIDFTITTGAGNDSVVVNLMGTTASSFFFELGGGNDSFDVNMTDPPDPSIPQIAQTIHMNVDAGAGDDRVDLDFQGRFQELTVDVATGAGDDVIIARFREIRAIGDMQELLRVASIFLRADLGAGHFDSASLIVEDLVLADARFGVDVRGCDGRDAVDIVTVNVAGNGLFDVRSDLGGDNDTFDAEIAYPPTPIMPDPAGALTLRSDVSTGAGDDSVNLLTVPPDPSMPGSQSALRLNFEADLGAGNDHFAFDGTIAGKLTVLGGKGDDEINARMGIEPTPFLPNFLNEINVDGGAGNDFISLLAEINARMGIEPTPFLPNFLTEINVDGGAGHDFISVLAEIDARMGIGSTPFVPNVVVDVNIKGGLGDDTLSARGIINRGVLVGFNPQPEPPIFHLIMDGGAGADVVDAVFSGELSALQADLDVSLFGGAGDDLLTLLWDEEVWNALAFADGGAGFDAGIFSPGTKHVRVERVG